VHRRAAQFAHCQVYEIAVRLVHRHQGDAHHQKDRKKPSCRLKLSDVNQIDTATTPNSKPGARGQDEYPAPVQRQVAGRFDVVAKDPLLEPGR
jgi:hypothetical protein